jgi:hypothetical protein
MGKMPLATLIGACGLGMLLTGCNTTKSNNNPPPPYAGGKADGSLGLLSQKRAKPSPSPLGGGTSLADNSLGSTSSTTAGSTADPLSTTTSNSGAFGGGSTLGGSGTGMPSPNSFGGASMSNGSGSSYPPANGSLAPGRGSSGLGSSPASLGSGGVSSLPSSSGFGSRTSSSAIQPVGGRSDSFSSVTNASYQNMDKDLTPALPMSGGSLARSIPPIPPPTSGDYAPLPSSRSSSASSSTSKTSSSWPSAPPAPPPSSLDPSLGSSNTMPSGLGTTGAAGSSAAPTTNSFGGRPFND